MTQMNFFTSLPSQITAVIVSNYLRLKDIAKLDIAFTNKATRKHFLSLYKEEACVLRVQYHSVITFTPDFCAWAYSRSVPVGGITLHKSWNTTHTPQLVNYLKDCGSHVWFFNTNLDGAETMTVTQYKSIVKQCPELKILAGIPVAFVTKHAMEVTRASCPDIFSLAVFGDEDCDEPGDVGALAVLFDEGGLSKLTSLRISVAYNLFQALMSVAANCPLLSKLNISTNKYMTIGEADLVMDALATNCPDLKELTLPAETLTDAGMVALSKCSALTAVQLHNCRQVTAAGFEALSKGCPNITELALFEVEVDPHDPQPLLHTTEFTNLTKLLLCCCTAVLDQDIMNIASSNPSLVEVRLQQCLNVTDDGVCYLSARCPLLKKLCVTYAQICNDTFSQLAKTSTQLTHLEISPMENFDETDGVREAFTNLTQLRRLDASHCSFFQDERVLRALLENCLDLDELVLRDCELCDDALGMLESADPPFQYVGEGTFQR